MKRLLSFLVLNALLCPTYAMDRSKEDFLTTLETKIEKYVNTDAACAQILRYYLLGRINVTQFKDLLKKKELFKDFAQLLRIDEATLHKHFDKIAPHLSEVTNEGALNQVIRTLVAGKQPDTKMLKLVIDQKKAIPLIAGLLGVETDGLNAFVQRLTDDPLITRKNEIQKQINSIDTTVLTTELTKLQAALAAKLAELNNCQNRIDIKNMDLQVVIQQNGKSALPSLIGVAATGWLASNVLCLSCDSYINGGYAALTALAAAGTAIMHRNSSQDQSNAVKEASDAVRKEIAKKETLQNDIVALRGQIQNAENSLNAENQNKTGLEKQLAQVAEDEAARGSFFDQGLGLAQEALKGQVIKFLAAKAGIDLAEMQAPEADADLQAFINSLTEEQKRLVDPLVFKFMAVSSEAVNLEMAFLASLDNNQCEQLAALFEKDNAVKALEFEAFADSVKAKISLLKTPERFGLAQYQPFLLIVGEEFEFIGALSLDQYTQYFNMIDDRFKQFAPTVEDFKKMTNQ